MGSQSDRDDVKQFGLITTSVFGALLSANHPLLGLILGSVPQYLSVLLNSASQKKLEERVKSLEASISRIDVLLRKGEQNFEALILAPEVLKQYMIVEEPRRATEYLSIFESLFIPGRIEFDGVQELFRVLGALSGNEYKLLRLMPETLKAWHEIFPNKEYELARAEWGAAIKRLEAMYLIHLEVPSYPGPVNTKVEFGDEEMVQLSVFGQRILETLEKVRGTSMQEPFALPGD